MARVKVCRLCGHHNSPDELFCTECGTSLADVRAADTAELEQQANDTRMDAPPSAAGHTVRDISPAPCAVLFPWGRVPVVGELRIGREEGFSAISGQLDAYPTVSRQHAVVAPAGAQWAVRDLGSTNGTYVNGARLGEGETRTIGNGDRVGFSKGLEARIEIGAA